MIEQENVKVTKDDLGKILSLLEKEKLIEMEENKNSEAAAAAAVAATKSDQKVQE